MRNLIIKHLEKNNAISPKTINKKKYTKRNVFIKNKAKEGETLRHFEFEKSNFEAEFLALITGSSTPKLEKESEVLKKPHMSISQSKLDGIIQNFRNITSTKCKYHMACSNSAESDTKTYSEKKDLPIPVENISDNVTPIFFEEKTKSNYDSFSVSNGYENFSKQDIDFFLNNPNENDNSMNFSHQLENPMLENDMSPQSIYSKRHFESQPSYSRDKLSTTINEYSAENSYANMPLLIQLSEDPLNIQITEYSQIPRTISNMEPVSIDIVEHPLTSYKLLASSLNDSSRVELGTPSKKNNNLSFSEEILPHSSPNMNFKNNYNILVNGISSPMKLFQKCKLKKSKTNGVCLPENTGDTLEVMELSNLSKNSSGGIHRSREVDDFSLFSCDYSELGISETLEVKSGDDEAKETVSFTTDVAVPLKKNRKWLKRRKVAVPATKVSSVLTGLKKIQARCRVNAFKKTAQNKKYQYSYRVFYQKE